MSYPVFTKQEFMAGLDRLGEADARKLLRGGALDGDEARWTTEWLARGGAVANETQDTRFGRILAA